MSESERRPNKQGGQEQDQDEPDKNPAGERRITYIAIVILLVGVASIAGVSTLDYFKGDGFWSKSAADSKKTESKASSESKSSESRK